MSELHPTLIPLQKLLGTWKLTGRLPHEYEDTIFGENTFRPILDGAYLEITGWMQFGDLRFESLEIIYFDEHDCVFKSLVYTYMGGKAVSAPVLYEWEVNNDGTIIHRGAGAKYIGMFSEDGNVLDGGWRPDEESDQRSEASYDATMTRIV